MIDFFQTFWYQFFHFSFFENLFYRITLEMFLLERLVTMSPACQNLLISLKVETHFSLKLHCSLPSSGSKSPISYFRKSFWRKGYFFSVRPNPEVPLEVLLLFRTSTVKVFVDFSFSRDTRKMPKTSDYFDISRHWISYFSTTVGLTCIKLW